MPRIIIVCLNYLYIKNIDTEAFAQFSNLYAIISFVNIFLSFGFETTYFRFSADEGQEGKTFNTTFFFLFALSAAFLLAVYIFNQPLADFLGYKTHPEYILWFAIIAFLDNLLVIPLAWLRFHNRPLAYTGVRVSQAIFQTLTVIAFFLWVSPEFLAKFGMKEKVSYTFYSNMAASFFGLILVLPIILKIKFQFSIALFRKMIRYSWPIMVAGFAFMLNENFDKAIQIYEIPPEEAGAYGGCYKLAVLMTLFVTAYRMGIEPYFFKQMKNENAKITYAKVTEYFSFFACVVALGIIANISWLKQLLIPNKSYWIAIDIIPIIVVANLCFGIYYNLSTWYKVTDKTVFGTFISWIGGILTIVLNLIFLPKYGFMVSAWVTFSAYFVMMLLSYFLGQKFYPIPYRIKKISIFLGMLMIFSLITVKVFHYHFWASNALFAAYTAVLIFSERNFILRKIRN